MIRPIRNAMLSSPAPIVLNRDGQTGHATAGTSFAETPADPVLAAPAPIQRAMPARYRTTRPDAAFLAQLIATAQGLPQTCARRRADPQEAAQAYDKAYGAASAAPTERMAPVAA